MLEKNQLLLNLIKIAIAKKINNIPITIKAMFIIFVIVEFPDFWTSATLLTDTWEVFDAVFEVFDDFELPAVFFVEFVYQ